MFSDITKEYERALYEYRLVGGVRKSMPVREEDEPEIGCLVAVPLEVATGKLKLYLLILARIDVNQDNMTAVTLQPV